MGGPLTVATGAELSTPPPVEVLSWQAASAARTAMQGRMSRCFIRRFRVVLDCLFGNAWKTDSPTAWGGASDAFFWGVGLDVERVHRAAHEWCNGVVHEAMALDPRAAAEGLR